jgi:cytochrome c-type biogenesis protein CcmF
MLPWKRARLAPAFRKLTPVFILALAVMALIWAVQTGRSAMGPIGAALGVWLVGGAVVDLLNRAGRGSIKEKLPRLARLPGADWGRGIAHAGLGVTMFGIAGLMAWEMEDIRVAQIGEPYLVGEYEITLNNVQRIQGPNYIATQADLTVTNAGRLTARLFPEKRVYPVAQMPTTEAAISNGILRDIYLVIGDPQQGGGWAVRTYIKPLANWIWAGSLMMAIGGLFSLADRRTRVAVTGRKKLPVGTPAE